MKKYSIIYADPPWAYRTYSKKGQGRSAESHYPTMCIEDIKALPVGELAAKDCALFLWITFPCLCEALEVLTAWGFSYKTVAFVWVKQNRKNDDLFTGMGYWTRANAEICILATKGHPKRVDAGVRQVILSHIEEHSKKPDEARERIVRLMGDLPRVELFARQSPEGWDVWGNEVECTAHANIHKALKYAVKIDLIDVNPADKVERPKKDRYVGSFYDAEEVNALFEAAKGTKLELPILFGAFYGLRRSEAIGLKWDAIDFEQNTITIRHTVTSCDLDGKRILVASDTTKTKSSMRTLPLVPFMRERLLALKEEQQENRRLCGRSYIKDYLEYVCVNEIGDLIKPHYVTESFPKLLKANGMRQIRYHDLRHSCASLLLANGVPMKQIQEWLGHSDFSTTANIYAHLDYSSKLTSADAMLNGLGFAQN